MNKDVLQIVSLVMSGVAILISLVALAVGGVARSASYDPNEYRKDHKQMSERLTYALKDTSDTRKVMLGRQSELLQRVNAIDNRLNAK